MAKPAKGLGSGLTKAKPGPTPFAWTEAIESEIFERIAKGVLSRAQCHPLRSGTAGERPSFGYGLTLRRGV